MSVHKKVVTNRHLGFEPSGSSAICSTDTENSALESNRKWTGWPVAERRTLEIFQNGCQVL